MPHQWSYPRPHIPNGATPSCSHPLYTWKAAFERLPILPTPEYYPQNTLLLLLALILHSLIYIFYFIPVYNTNLFLKHANINIFVQINEQNTRYFCGETSQHKYLIINTLHHILSSIDQQIGDKDRIFKNRCQREATRHDSPFFNNQGKIPFRF